MKSKKIENFINKVNSPEEITVLSIKESTITEVTMQGCEHDVYTRHSNNVWTFRAGQSDELLNDADTKEMEALYQKWTKNDDL